jgi:glycosyltransferase involved in cell wall biosynthesis
MKRILIIPSWYPNAKQPYLGIFFQEQALLATSEFDVRVMVIETRPVGRRSILSWLGKVVFGPKITILFQQSTPDSPALYKVTAEVASWGNKIINWSDERVFRKICRIFADWMPDLIHAQCAIRAGVFARIMARMINVPYVVTEHQHVIFDYFSPSEWEQAKRVYTDAKVLSVISEFAKQILMMNGVKTTAMVIGEFVDEVRFTLRTFNTLPDRSGILFVGTTSRLKDHLTFFRALTLLKQRQSSPFIARMVSPSFLPDDNAYLKTKIEEYGLTNDVHLIASASREEVIDLINQSDVLVSTSIAETFGIAVCEALMCGCPVVATKSGGVSDFVKDGENGYLVSIGDAERVAQRIIDVFNGTLTMSPQAMRQSVLHNYGRDGFLAKLRILYST